MKKLTAILMAMLLVFSTFAFAATAIDVEEPIEETTTEVEETTKSGIILTAAAKEKPQIAEVVAVGPGTKDVTMELAVGDQVIMSKYAGTEIKLDGEEYIVLSQNDILAKIQ